MFNPIRIELLSTAVPHYEIAQKMCTSSACFAAVAHLGVEGDPNLVDPERTSQEATDIASVAFAEVDDDYITRQMKSQSTSQ